MKQIEIIVNQLNNELAILGCANSSVCQNTEEALSVVKSTIYNLRNIIGEKGFKNIQDEIQFFKNIKPKVCAQLIYFSFVIEYNLMKSCNEEMLRKFKKTRENYFIQIMNENYDFLHHYYRRSNLRDEEYFTRYKYQPPTNTLGLIAMNDPSFCTYHGLVLDYLEAYQLIKNYIFKDKNRSHNIIYTPLSWTSNKASLVELMYALHMSGSLNNGTIDLKEIASSFEKMFNIELGEYYRTFHELKTRKDPTKFINLLRDKLNEKINEEDEFTPD